MHTDRSSNEAGIGEGLKMKKIKYITIAMLFFLFVTIMTETKVYNSDFLIHMSDSSTYYAFDLKTHDKARNKRFLSVFESKANERDLGIYVVYQNNQNYNQKTYTIYANKIAKEILKNRLDRSEDSIKIKSSFIGKSKIEFQDFQKLTLKNEYCIQFFGDIEKAREIREELYKVFDSSAVYPGQGLEDVYFTENGICVIALMLVLLSSVYYMSMIKKEYIVRKILGESTKCRIFKNLIFDAIVLSLLLGGILWAYRGYLGEQIHIKYYIIMLLLFILVSSIPEIIFGLTDAGKIQTREKRSKGFRILSYVIKGVVLITTIILISSNLFFVIQGFNVIRQEKHWKKLQNYNSVYIPVSNTDVNTLRKEFPNLGENYNYTKYKNSLLEVLEKRTQLEFYFDNYKTAFIFGVQSVGDGMPPTYVVNKNAANLILKEQPQLKKILKGKNAAVLYPKGKRKFVQTDVKNLKSTNIISYDEDIEVFNYDRNSRMIHENSYIKNPIIYLIDGKPNQDLRYKIEGIKNEQETNLILNEKYYSIERILSVQSESIYFDMNRSDSKFQSFLNRRKGYIDKFYVQKEDVYKTYQGEKTIYRNILYVNSVMMVMVMLLDLFLLQMILKMEFQIDAIEIALKKVLGYNKRERYKEIYRVSMIASFVSFITSIILLILFKDIYVYYAIAGYVIVMLIEQGMFQRLVYKYEKNNIPSILKGAKV